MSFQIKPLAAGRFRDLFNMSDDELRQHQTVRMIVDTFPSMPCRVSLEDAKIGETVILTNFQHQPNPTPYQASHAVYVREHAQEAGLPPDQVPDMLQRRQISVRLFSEQHMMIDADVVDGTKLKERLEQSFVDLNVAYIHLHFAGAGCFAASVLRAGEP